MYQRDTLIINQLSRIKGIKGEKEKMEKMLVTQALNELKTLDSRINREISNAKFVAASKVSEKNVSSNVTKEEFIEKAKANLQSVTDLIERRKKIKAAIVDSNAKETITIGGVTMSRADAIERKSSVEYEVELLNTMKAQYATATLTVAKNNNIVNENIDKLVTTAFGKASQNTIKEDDYNTIANPYKKANEFGLVDPVDIESEIKKREEEIETFKSKIDSALQISNCTTWIEF